MTYFGLKHVPKIDLAIIDFMGLRQALLIYSSLFLFEFLYLPVSR